MEFPRLVYRFNSELKYQLVEDEKEFKSAINNGWFENVPDAKNITSVETIPDNNAPPTREEMEIQAKELGIKFDGRTSDAKLLNLINEALEK